MKSNWILLLVVGLFCWRSSNQAASPTNDPTYVLLSEEHDKTPLEGLLVKVTPKGEYELDSGTRFQTEDELGTFLQLKRDVFAPRLVVEAASPDLICYHKAMQALLLFKKHCRQYSLIIQAESKK